MKKFLDRFFVIVLSVGMLSACGSGEANSALSESGTEQITEEAQGEERAGVTRGNRRGETAEEATPEETTEEEETAEEETTEEAVTGESAQEETDSSDSVTLLDENEMTIEFRGIEEYYDYGYLINLYIENNTDAEIYVSLQDLRVNQYSLRIYDEAGVGAGAKYLSEPNNVFIIARSDLEACEIATMESLEFDLTVSDSSWGDPIAEKPVSLDVREEIAGTREEDSEGTSEILWDENDLLIEFRGLEDYYEYGWIINLYIENHSDTEIYVSLEDLRVNQYALGLYDEADVGAGAKYLAEPNDMFILFQSDLESCGITTMESLEFDLTVNTGPWGGGESIAEKSISLDLAHSGDTDGEAEETNAAKSSDAEFYYNVCMTLTKEDCIQNEEGLYVYNDITFLPEECKSIDNTLLNPDGSVPRRALYLALQAAVSEYPEGEEWKAYAGHIIGFTPASAEEFEPYAEELLTYMTDSFLQVSMLEKFMTMSSVRVEADDAEYTCTIPDVTDCAEELDITEEMLGYTLAALVDAGAEITFDGAACTVVYVDANGDLS